MKVNVVVFLAFFMTRPSDSAPRSKLYDEPNTRNLVFPEDKSYDLYFFVSRMIHHALALR